MAPSIQAQHVVAVTIPTIAVIFLTYLWYKRRSNSATRGRNDPGGGGATSKKRRNRNMVSTMPSVSVPTSVEQPQEGLPEAMKTAMQKVIRDLETASAIQEICSDSEDGVAASVLETASADAASSTTVGHSEAPVEQKKIVRVEESSPAVEKTIDRLTQVADENQVESSANPNQEANRETPVRESIADASASSPAVMIDDDDDDDRITQWSAIVDRGDELLTRAAEECPPADGPKDASATVGVEASTETTTSAKHCRENAAHASDREDLDAAVQKLESMRLGDKPPKRKSNSSKRHSTAKDAVTAAAAAAAAAAAEAESSRSSPPSGGGKSKLPSSIASQLTSPSSKIKKRKSRKKSKNGGGSDAAGDEIVHNCKSSCSEATPAAAVSVSNACDARKSFDPCSRTSPSAKSAFRMCLPDNENLLRSSTESDSLRCTLKKTGDYDLKVIEHHQVDCDNERDSANHSPVDTMLDSQLVQFSDAHSEGSSDSGKGCSEGAASPTPHTPVGGSSVSEDQNLLLVYQFVIPQEHVGKLIGKHGQFINNIKATSNTKIYIKKHPTSYKKKLCALEGTQQEINKALELIRNRFPEDTYPDITLEEFPISLPIPCPLRSELFQLDLVEGVNNDVVISSVVSAGHLFLQQPMHPTYQSLSILNLNMNQVYSSPEAPSVLKPIKDNIVAAPAMDGWYRAQIVSVDDETGTCEVRFLDYGGYLSLSTSCLRAVRADFLTLPFQAVECYLANVSPMNDTWCEEAKLIVQGLTYGHILQAQVYDYTPDGIPLILLFAVHGTQVILINQELIARGYAYSTLPSEGAQSEEYYYCP